MSLHERVVDLASQVLTYWETVGCIPSDPEGSDS